MYYKRYEMQKRNTVYNTAGIVAGAFGGVRVFSSFRSMNTMADMLLSFWHTL